MAYEAEPLKFFIFFSYLFLMDVAHFCLVAKRRFLFRTSGTRESNIFSMSLKFPFSSFHHTSRACWWTEFFFFYCFSIEHNKFNTNKTNRNGKYVLPLPTRTYILNTKRHFSFNPPPPIPRTNFCANIYISNIIYKLV